MDDQVTAEVDEEVPRLWDGYYEKVFYLVHLPSGEKVKCWPNAGYMNSADGSGRMWEPDDKIFVTVEDVAELRSEKSYQRSALAREELVKRAVLVMGENTVGLAEAAIRRFPPLAPVIVDMETPGPLMPQPEGWRTVLSVDYAKAQDEAVRLALQYDTRGSLRVREVKRLKRERYLRKKRK